MHECLLPSPQGSEYVISQVASTSPDGEVHLWDVAPNGAKRPAGSPPYFASTRLQFISSHAFKPSEITELATKLRTNCGGMVDLDESSATHLINTKQDLIERGRALDAAEPASVAPGTGAAPPRAYGSAPAQSIANPAMAVPTPAATAPSPFAPRPSGVRPALPPGPMHATLGGLPPGAVAIPPMGFAPASHFPQLIAGHALMHSARPAPLPGGADAPPTTPLGGPAMPAAYGAIAYHSGAMGIGVAAENGMSAPATTSLHAHPAAAARLDPATAQMQPADVRRAAAAAASRNDAAAPRPDVPSPRPAAVPETLAGTAPDDACSTFAADRRAEAPAPMQVEAPALEDPKAAAPPSGERLPVDEAAVAVDGDGS